MEYRPAPNLEEWGQSIYWWCIAGSRPWDKAGGVGWGWDLRASVWFKNKAGGGPSRPLPWIRHYDGTFYVSATALTVVKDQWELSNRATWTQDHPKKPRYRIIGTRQKLSRCVESALPLWLDVQQLDQTQKERLFIGLDTRPVPFLAIPWCSSKKRVAVLLTIPVKYCVI